MLPFGIKTFRLRESQIKYKCLLLFGNRNIRGKSGFLFCFLRQEAFPPSVHQELETTDLTLRRATGLQGVCLPDPTPALLRQSLLPTLQAQSHAHTLPGVHPCGSLLHTLFHTLPCTDRRCHLSTWLSLARTFSSFSSRHSPACLEPHCQSPSPCLSTLTYTHTLLFIHSIHYKLYTYFTSRKLSCRYLYCLYK